jgi:hypothetical protein
MTHDHLKDRSRAHTPTSEIIARRYETAVANELERFRATIGGEGRLGIAVIALLAVLSMTVVFIPLASKLYRRAKANRQYHDLLLNALKFARGAKGVMAFPLMVNSMLRRPGADKAPGLFLISFDEQQGNSIKSMGGVAIRVGEASSANMSAADAAFCEALLADEDFRPFRRRKLPDAITDGHPVYAVDLAVSQLMLAGRHISDEFPLVPCVAEPGDQGRIVQMPYWLVNGNLAPTESERQEFLTSLVWITALAQMGTGGQAT